MYMALWSLPSLQYTVMLCIRIVEWSANDASIVRGTFAVCMLTHLALSVCTYPAKVAPVGGRASRCSVLTLVPMYIVCVYVSVTWRAISVVSSSRHLVSEAGLT